MPEEVEARAALGALIAERRSDCAALSRLIGRNSAYVQQYLKRGSPRRLAERDRRLLAEFFGVDETVLGAPSDKRKRLVDVARLDVRAAAGTGALEGIERPVAHIAFDPVWLRRVARGRPEDLSLIRVAGDSMTPALSDGDDILVDRGDAEARLRDGIYVLRIEEGLLVKRLVIESDGLVSVRSDNPAYPVVPPRPRNDLEIIGRVVWTGRRLD